MSAEVSRDRLRNRSESLRENETRDGSTNGGAKGLRMNVTINLSLSEEERNSRRCIHSGVSDREWKRVSNKIDAISFVPFLSALLQSR